MCWEDYVSETQGLVLFFTGLSGSGKTTLSKELIKFFNKCNTSLTVLDGDIVRKNLSKGLGFSKEDRDTNVLRIGFVASEIVKHGGTVICAAIAPYDIVREKVRRMVESTGGRFILIYLSTSLEYCEGRDIKGLYKKAREGKLENFTGVSDPYEPPKSPNIILDTETLSVKECMDRIFSYIFWMKN